MAKKNPMGGKGPSGRKEPEKEPGPDRTKPPTEADLEKLPRWARVAFAARCARRVQPLYRCSVAPALRDRAVVIDGAIDGAEACARLGRRGDAVAIAALNAALAVRKYEESAQAAQAILEQKAAAGISEADRATTDGIGVIAAWLAALAATGAAHAAGEPAQEAAGYAAEGADAAATAGELMASAGEILRAMWSDVDRLGSLAETHCWSNRSPVDGDLCGPLWADAVEPAWRRVAAKAALHV